jgi:hypothetical protein
MKFYVFNFFFISARLMKTVTLMNFLIKNIINVQINVELSISILAELLVVAFIKFLFVFVLTSFIFLLVNFLRLSYL